MHLRRIASNRERVLLVVFVFATATAVSRSAHAEGPLLAGPMVGHVTSSSGRIWLQRSEGAELTARATQAGRTYEPTRVEDLGQGFAIVHFEGFDPASPVRIMISVISAAGERARAEASFRTAPRPALTGKVRIALGSCVQDARYGRVPVFEAMAEEAADAAIFLGDNSYFIVGGGDFGTRGPKGDWNSAELMRARHLQTRTNTDLQRLLASTPCYAVWDDHDFGPDNSGRDFALKEDALAVFQQIWANPRYGTSGVRGIFSSFRLGPAEIFLMDGRYHKYVSNDTRGEVPEEAAAIWGEEQLLWLMAGLKATTAPLKVIVNGTQFISQSEGGEGHYREARGEYNRLLDFIARNRIGGVIFLSGDRHYSEVMRLRREGQPDILEFTSSPIQQNSAIGPLRGRNPTRLWGMRGNSYGLLTIEVTGPGRGTIRMEARDEMNHVPILGGARMVTNFELSDLEFGPQ